MPAPQPQRVASSNAVNQFPVQQTWNPEMGIKFGGNSGGGAGNGQQAGQPQQPTPGTWDPNRGLRFG